jgi:hypothetical protein
LWSCSKGRVWEEAVWEAATTVWAAVATQKPGWAEYLPPDHLKLRLKEIYVSDIGNKGMLA